MVSADGADLKADERGIRLQYIERKLVLPDGPDRMKVCQRMGSKRKGGRSGLIFATSEQKRAASVGLVNT